VNANLVVDQHPLPKPEDLLTSLSGGQKFSIPITAAQLKAATNRDAILIKVLRYIKRGWLTEVPDTLRP